jgi:uncharacterized protein (DUF1800 family)
MLTTPPSGDPAFPPPLAADGSANDRLATTDELIMDWLDIMQRAVNPLPERLAFFWHRHWAASIADGSISFTEILAYRDRMRRYANFAADPGLSFRDFAWEMTTQDAAMSLYLNSNQNIKRAPNENYAREFMELFCLGPNGPDGTPNYVQADVSELARAFTGWRLDSAAETISFPDNNGNFDAGQKVVLGRTIPAVTSTKAIDRIPTVRQAVDIVLEHANHPQFLIRKLLAEFIASPIPQATLDDLIAQYKAGGYALRPLIRGILTHPLIFESLGEPNLVKPPVVYFVGLLRQLGAPG